jgi:uncharacterized protein (TIGR02246 family)
MSETTEQVARRQDEAAIRALEAAYDRAWDRGDIDALVESLTPDATIIDPFGGVSAGAEQIRRLFSELLTGRGRRSTHASTILGVRFVAAGVALADGEAVIEGIMTHEGALRPPLVHRFTDVVVRVESGWRIAQVRAYVLMDGPRP